MMMKVAVGMSGGVDSAVAAYLLREAGHEVIGVTSLNYPESRCCDTRSLMEARRAAEFLGIAHHVIDVLHTFQARVIDPFLAGYRAGVTPNPCTTCNSRVRFEEVFDEAEWRFGVEAFATGHYARVDQDLETRRWRLRRGVDPTKDQSYMLARLDQAQLARSLFPLGELTKAETRLIAHRLGLSAADTPDSQDVCFVMGDARGFLERHLGDTQQPGPIRHLDGRLLGTHAGIAYYTVGQRRGLGIAHPEPLYVVRVEPETNTLVVGPMAATTTRRVTIADMNWVAMSDPGQEFEAEAQLRYRSAPVRARVIPTQLGWDLVVETDRLPATPGQVAVLYAGDVVLASGIIQHP